MSKSPKGPSKGTVQDIDIGLNGLFGALSDAISDVVAKLEDGSAGTVARDHVFDTEKGPIRAQAGIRLRMGGHDLGGDQPAPKPFKAKTKDKTDQPPRTNSPMVYDILEDASTWTITADVPGVTQTDLSIKQDGQVLHIETTGKRRYATGIDLEQRFDLAQATQTLHNGILTLVIPKGDAT